MPFMRDQILKEYVDGSLAVKIIIEPKDKRRFLDLFPDPGLRGAMVRLVEDHERGKSKAPARSETPKTAAGSFGQQAKELRTHLNWMTNPKVWAAFGSDDDYLEWLRNQPCAYCRSEAQWCEAAHVRRIANGAGTAIKPPFSAIPLCHADHQRQHTHGESALGGKDWFDKQRIVHVQEWLWHTMKTLFSVSSMREVHPALLLAYAQEAGIEQYLPDCYREARDETF